MKELLGHKIKQIAVSLYRQHNLVVFTDKGVFSYECDGDCCSETWIADIIGTRALLTGGPVHQVIELEDYSLTDDRCRQDVDTVYGYKLVTDKGACEVIFRNSSNGHYGGSLDLMPPGKVVRDDLEFITDDWQANQPTQPESDY